MIQVLVIVLIYLTDVLVHKDLLALLVAKVYLGLWDPPALQVQLEDLALLAQEVNVVTEEKEERKEIEEKKVIEEVLEKKVREETLDFKV